MLIQISNRCDEGCPHCLQDSRNSSRLFDDEEQLTRAREILGIDKQQ